VRRQYFARLTFSVHAYVLRNIFETCDNAAAMSGKAAKASQLKSLNLQLGRSHFDGHSRFVLSQAQPALDYNRYKSGVSSLYKQKFQRRK